MPNTLSIRNDSRNPFPVRALLFSLWACLVFQPAETQAQALQSPDSRQTNYFDGATTGDPSTQANPSAGAAATDVGNKNMPNLYYAYADPAYTTGAANQAGFNNDVVQKVVLAIQGVTRPTTSTIYGSPTQMYKYVWGFFGMLIFFGLLLSGWHTYHEVISGRATNDIWVWYVARIVVAALMWTSLINNGPIMLIAFINQFTGMPSSGLTAQLKNRTTKYSDSNAYLQAIATGNASDTLAPYLTSVAVAYNTLDKSVVGKSAQAIGSVVDFQKQLNINPQQAQQWVEQMYGVSYQIHLDNQGSNALESQYGYNLTETTEATRGGLAGIVNVFNSRSQVAQDMANSLKTFSGIAYTPPPQLSGDDQLVAVFLASQRAASAKFYIQLTNRLRALAGQPLLAPPGTTPTTADGWLGPGGGTMPAGTPALRYPDSTTPAQNGNNPSNANQDNTLTAAGMLENAIPQPGEAPPVASLVHQPALVKNVVNFAMVEIGISIWSLPLLLMMMTVFLVLPPQLTGKSYTQHAAATFLHILTLIIACALITTFVELATMNSASGMSAIAQANKTDIGKVGANINLFVTGALFGAYDPVTMFYCGLIIAALPIAVGIVQGSNKMASAAWGALNASGMSGVTPMAAIESGQTNSIGGGIIRGGASMFTGGASELMYDHPVASPRAPTSPGK
jgi:hypothetical protein